MVRAAPSIKGTARHRCPFGSSLTASLACLGYRPLHRFTYVHHTDYLTPYPGEVSRRGGLSRFLPRASLRFGALSRQLFIHAGRFTRWNRWFPTYHGGNSSNKRHLVADVLLAGEVTFKAKLHRPWARTAATVAGLSSSTPPAIVPHPPFQCPPVKSLGNRSPAAAPFTPPDSHIHRLGIPANVNGHSGDRDRCAHRGGAGVHFLDQPFTISQVSAAFSSWNLLSVGAGGRCARGGRGWRRPGWPRR